MKYSRQREAIFQAVQNSKEHPTADTVYEQVRATNPQISLGTVYRNLNQLADSGMLLKISMPYGSDRFDGRMDEHYHMTCTGCGRVVDVDVLSLSTLDREIFDATGFRVHNHHMVLEGTCRECAKKREAAVEKTDTSGIIAVGQAK